MNNQNNDENEILCILTDLDMKQEEIKKTLKSFHLKQWEKINWILTSHRSRLLSDIHEEQDQLYLLDFLTRKLKEAKNTKL